MSEKIQLSSHRLDTSVVYIEHERELRAISNVSRGVVSSPRTKCTAVF
jgi:hypothetical protein